MTHMLTRRGRLLGVLLLGLGLALSSLRSEAAHDIRGITGPTFNLYAFPMNISLPEGSSMYMWAFGDMDAGANATHPEGAGYNRPQYPGPTLIVNQGDTVTINLTNFGVPQPVSLVVTGHNVSAAGGAVGLLTNTSSNPSQTVSYTFTAAEPGTYIYHSLDGANPGLHVEMGLLGALIVRPTGYDAATNRIAYGPNTPYDQEFLYLLTEIDPIVHLELERGHFNHFTHSDRFPTIYLVNGRVFPDLFQSDYNSVYPNQPYQALAQGHPGDRVLVREVNAGQDAHPFHHHGENLRFIARDGRLLTTTTLPDGSPDPLGVPNLGRSDNTLNSEPKQTVDMLWTWTGKDLNWDIYGPVNTACTDANNDMADDTTGAMCHDDSCIDLVDNRSGAATPDGFDDFNFEYCADHGKALPVTLPGVQDLTVGGWWSGSPFMGDVGALPPGEGGLNPFGGYFFVWHSHNEKELTTFDIFPGGSLSAVVVLPPYVDIQ